MRSGRTRGFTLIEVLVVVAIIALLVSILLPSLTQAREQAKVVRCVANHKALGIASAAYINSNMNRFPWTPVVHKATGDVEDIKNAPVAYSNYFGGKRGIGDPPDGPLHIYYGQSRWYDFLASERPINRYVTAAKLGKSADLQVFACPAERPPVNGGLASRNNYLVQRSKTTAYDACGTSYQSNVTWYVYTRTEYADSPSRAKRVLQLFDRIISVFERLGPSRAILLHEDPSDCILGGVITTATNRYPPDFKLPGWHGKVGMYTTSFVDGHAAYSRIEAKMNIDHRTDTKTFTECSASDLTSGTGRCAQGTATWVARQNYRQQ